MTGRWCRDREPSARRPNPSSRRSPLIALTRRGRAAARRMAAREGKYFGEHVPSLTGAEMRRAAATLRAFTSALTVEER